MFASMLYLRLTLLSGFVNFFSDRSRKKKFKVVLKKFRYPSLLEGCASLFLAVVFFK